MSLIVIIGLVLSAFTMAGRCVTPKPERLPLRDWTVLDAWRNLLRGLEVWAPLQDRLPLR